jgi:hypothetical protein
MKNTDLKLMCWKLKYLNICLRESLNELNTVVLSRKFSAGDILKGERLKTIRRLKVCPPQPRWWMPVRGGTAEETQIFYRR